MQACSGSSHLFSVSRESHPLQPSYRYDLLDGLKASLTLKPVYAMKLAKALKEAANTAQVRRAVLCTPPLYLGMP